MSTCKMMDKSERKVEERVENISGKIGRGNTKKMNKERRGVFENRAKPKLRCGRNTWERIRHGSVLGKTKRCSDDTGKIGAYRLGKMGSKDLGRGERSGDGAIFQMEFRE